MKAILYKKDGKLVEMPIEKIDSIFPEPNGKELCISLAGGAGEKWCKFMAIEPGEAKE